MFIENKEVMSENIKKYLNLKGITQTQLANDLNLPLTTVASWIQAKSYPRIDKIEMMANYFHISKADLVEKFDFNPDTGKRDAKLLLDFHNLTPAHQQAVLNLVDSLLTFQNE